MATRNQVLSLFGATPQQIQEQERLRQAEFLAAQRDPYQSAGAAIGVGLGRLFGGESAEMAQARQMQEAVAGIDPNNPDALRALAQSVSQFAPQQALQIAAYAGELEKSQMGATVPVPTIVGYETEPDIDPTTGLQRLDANKNPMFKRNPVYRNVPFERTPDGLRSLVPGYSLPSGASTAVADNVDTPDTPDTQTRKADAVWDPETGMKIMPKDVEDSQVPVTANVPPESQERISMQSGPRGGTEGALGQIAPVPDIQGQVTYMNPQEAQRVSDQLRDEITALENSNAPDKQEQIRALKKRRAEVNKIRIASRRQDREKANRKRRGK